MIREFNQATDYNAVCGNNTSEPSGSLYSREKIVNQLPVYYNSDDQIGNDVMICRE
jgi:hypothetical protein